MRNLQISEVEKKIFDDKVNLLETFDFKEWAETSFSDKHFQMVFCKVIYNLSGNSVLVKREITDALSEGNEEISKDIFADVLLHALKTAIHLQRK